MIASMLHAIIVIVLVLLVVAGLGGKVTAEGMKWYRRLSVPPWTPPGAFIGSVWTLIYILSGASAFLFWYAEVPEPWKAVIVAAFLINAALNILWSVIFFAWHSIGGAFAESLVLELSVIALIFLLLPFSYLAAMLLVPYAAWVLFASFLTFTVWQANRP